MAKTSDRELELDLRSALISTGHVEPVSVEISSNKVDILCRSILNRDSMWLKDVWALLLQSEQDGVPVHLCKQYVLKKGKMVFGWHIGIESKNARSLKKDIDWFCKALKGALSATVPTEIVPTTQSVEPQPPPSSIKPADTVKDPNFKDDMDVRREAAMARTTASPRTPEYVPPRPPPPNARPVEMRTVHSGTATDSRNREVPVIIQEMPLPFTYTDDMNKPNEKGMGAKGKGA